uniref:Uncharacterized protein n=1 Tax=Zea mays TaxID=4577 RepID=C4IY36_MAIZE|nr:unknown [Zea mays]
MLLSLRHPPGRRESRHRFSASVLQIEPSPSDSPAGAVRQRVQLFPEGQLCTQDQLTLQPACQSRCSCTLQEPPLSSRGSHMSNGGT